MPTKTISIDLDAWERLRRARLDPRESFSRVIKRAVWPAPARSASGLVAALDSLPPLDEKALAGLEAAQNSDSEPEDPWRDR